MNYSVFFFFLGNCSLTFHFFLSITVRHRNRLLCRVASGMWQGCAARMCGPVCECDPFELFKAHLWPASLVTFYAFSHAVYFVYKRVALTYFVPHNERSWWSLINYKAFPHTHTHTRCRPINLPLTPTQFDLYGFSICALVLFSFIPLPFAGWMGGRISFLLHLPLYKFLVFAPISFQIERCPQSFIFNAPRPSKHPSIQTSKHPTSQTQPKLERNETERDRGKAIWTWAASRKDADQVGNGTGGHHIRSWFFSTFSSACLYFPIPIFLLWSSRGISALLVCMSAFGNGTRVDLPYHNTLSSSSLKYRTYSATATATATQYQFSVLF